MTLVYLWKACAMRMIDREQATVGERSSQQLTDVSTRSHRLMLVLTNAVGLDPSQSIFSLCI